MFDDVVDYKVWLEVGGACACTAVGGGTEGVGMGNVVCCNSDACCVSYVRCCVGLVGSSRNLVGSSRGLVGGSRGLVGGGS